MDWKPDFQNYRNILSSHSVHLYFCCSITIYDTGQKSHYPPGNHHAKSLLKNVDSGLFTQCETEMIVWQVAVFYFCCDNGYSYLALYIGWNGLENYILSMMLQKIMLRHIKTISCEVYGRRKEILFNQCPI